jgi:hypothetical protein
LAVLSAVNLFCSQEGKKVSGRRLVFFVAIFQFIPLLLYPPEILLSISPVFLVIAVLLLVLVGWQLIRGRAWAPIFSTFLQGFNIITRLIALFPHALIDEGAGGLNYSFLITGVLAILLSVCFLYLLGRPELESGLA